jgi:D-ribose pyranose/furanose isomerase RbsD
MLKRNIILGMFFAMLLSCNHSKTSDAKQINNADNNWKPQFDQKLPLLGHRNWIVIADKAFPEQNAAGIEVINTNENLLPVLKYVLEEINESGHVKPIIYQDKELQFITESQAKGISSFRMKSEKLLSSGKSGLDLQSQTILHDSVFAKLDEASKLFKIVVLKTNETIPYTSVFLQLDCFYWNAEKEKQLREKMKSQK